MVSTFGCAKADEVDLVERLSSIIKVGDEEDIVAELVEWPRLKGSRVENPIGCSRFREFCKAKSSVDRIWGHAFGYRGNFFRTCSFRQGVDYLYLLPDLAKEKKHKRLGDKVSLEYAQGVVKESRTGSVCCYLAQFDYGLTLPLRHLAKSRWAASGSKSWITAKDFMEYYAVKYVIATDGAYLSSSSSRPYFFDMSFAGRVWNENLVWVSGECLQRSDEEPLKLNNRTITKGISCKVSRKESFIDSFAKEGTKLEVALKKLGINRFKRVASKDDKVVLEESVKIIEGVDLRPRFEAETGLMEEQCRAKAREKGVIVVEDKFKKLELEKERESAALKLKEVRAKSAAETERLVSASATSHNNLAGKLYQLRYTKVEILAFSEENYEEKEIVDEKEVEEMEDGLNVAKKTVADNQETIDQKELDVTREREKQSLLYNAEYVEEYEALISQYEDRLDDNVKLSLKLEEAKSQAEDKTATLLSRDLALNQLISELAELKERAVSSSRHDAELVEYHIRALNDEISDMKCSIRALNEQLLKREIDLDTARTNLAVSEADFEKLSSGIVGKYLELRNSAQIRGSLITRLDLLKADLRHLKEREAKSRADLAEVQAKNKNLVGNLAHVYGNVRRAV
ncbi:hypothetical protein GIB67_040874 [Kingdonia uniflora]|uniref:Uncharacterized protein n=1 Tax=Kingdonia uniflora TaxID=39325 RepID=A0A7J7L829_9MAGN|nr:hypothetical protein GIB67_040874 [Kingdonia uniflora]